MRIDRLNLASFRNYDALDAGFCPGVNLILGDNAQGKTNLLEAVTYLSAGRSFRTRKELELIKFGADFCELSADVLSGGRERSIRAVLFADRRHRQLYLNGVKQKTAENMAGVLTTVLFCPENLMVLRAGATARRKMTDAALCQLRPAYLSAVEEYGRLLDHKSRILKDWHENPSLLDTLPEFNEQMARYGAVIIGYRARFLQKLGECAAEYHREFSSGREELRLFYRTVSNIDDPFASCEELTQKLRDHAESHLRAEKESGMCLSGPHKDDFETFLGDIALKSYGSQGQTRTAAISLKLAERELMRRDTGEEPILLLDDVLSELDERRQDFVLNQIRTGQVFITCCEKDRLTDIGETFLIADGKLK